MNTIKRQQWTAATIMATTVALAMPAVGSTLTENFDTTATGTVPSGWYSESDNGQTTAGVGTGSPASNGYKNRDLIIDTNATYDTTTLPYVDFSVDAYLDAGINQHDGAGPLGAGLSDASPTDDFGGVFSGTSGKHRIMVGLHKPDDGNPSDTNFALAYGGILNNFDSDTTFTDSFTLSGDTWYRFAGRIAWDAANEKMDFSNLALASLGSDGTAAPTAVSLSSTSVAITLEKYYNGEELKNNLDQAHVIFAGNRDRGVETIDNLVVTAVPEPASLALLGFGSLAMFSRRRRGR